MITTCQFGNSQLEKGLDNRTVSKLEKEITGGHSKSQADRR